MHVKVILGAKQGQDKFLRGVEEEAYPVCPFVPVSIWFSLTIFQFFCSSSYKLVIGVLVHLNNA